MPFPEQHWRLLAEGSDCGGLVLFPLDVSVTERESYARLLSDIERARAARFQSALQGARFVVAHGRLRQLLAMQLGSLPEFVQFTAGPHGKPELAGAAPESRLRFNLSHSGAVGVVGWGWQREIGADVEVWRAIRDETAVVRRYFSAAEIASWETLPQERRRAAFFNMWTRKEAYVKALGRGLALPLDSFDVSHESGGGAGECLLRPSALAVDSGPWSLAAPTTGLDVSVAVALQSPTLSVTPLG